jgi:long-subunit acyl-CoA synthetase (AMP-forming)
MTTPAPTPTSAPTAADHLILDHACDHARQRADEIYLTQPLGNAQVADYTWAEVMNQSRRMAAHLQSRGFARGARIAILSKNCAHFIMAELSIWLAGYTTVAIFPTETAETVRFVLEHSEASLLFVGKLDTWPAQQPGVPAALPRIALPLAPHTRDVEGYDTWDSVVERTAPLTGAPDRRGDELAMLIYTSGSTGQPKGVMTTFAAFTRAGAGVVDEVVRQNGGRRDRQRMLSYLPLAHSYERTWVEAASLVGGLTHLYFAESLDTFVQDIRRARPTLFVSVPRLWLKFQQGVFSKMPPAKLDRLLGIPLLGRLVARKVLKGLGLDQVTLAGSGSAPIPAELIVWYRRLGLKLMEGYAMTEDSSFSHTSSDAHNAPGYVGVPLPGVQVRISDTGEILIKSPGQFSGYYKQPELTAGCFTPDGYFRTGDLGERRADGLLKLTGRAKEQFKTSKGKFVAPAPIENRINAHPLVEMCMVSGVGQPAAYALVVLAESLRPRQTDPALRADVSAQLAVLLEDVNRALPEYEHLRMIVVASEPWTIENRCLTPTMKIRRSSIEAQVPAAQLENWYQVRDTVIWA